MQNNTSKSSNQSKPTQSQGNLSSQEQEALQQASWVLEMSKTKGWLQVLKPLLESRLHNQWLDPRQFKNAKEFIDAYNKTWAWADVVRELLSMIAGYEDTVRTLNNKQNNPKYRIGG